MGTDASTLTGLKVASGSSRPHRSEGSYRRPPVPVSRAAGIGENAIETTDREWERYAIELVPDRREARQCAAALLQVRSEPAHW